MSKRLVPTNFNVPEMLETDRVRLRMLTINDVVKDYDAVMSSREHLHATTPFGPKSKWPTADLTLEQNLIDLGWHQKEFQRKTSFAYTVMNLDETRCLGCVYIYSSANKEYDAGIFMWVRGSEVNKGLDEYLFTSVKDWINRDWLFSKPAYPGRSISWEEWNS